MRHHPEAHRIASELLAHDGILALRTRLLVRDVRTKHGVGYNTAMRAIALARSGGTAIRPVPRDVLALNPNPAKVRVGDIAMHLRVCRKTASRLRLRAMALPEVLQRFAPWSTSKECA